MPTAPKTNSRTNRHATFSRNGTFKRHSLKHPHRIQTALAYGLVNHVLPGDELLNKAKAILEVIVAKAPLAVGKCIAAANATHTTEGYGKELEGFGESFATEDMKEGTIAFLEKRKASFKGR